MKREAIERLSLPGFHRRRRISLAAFQTGGRRRILVGFSVCVAALACLTAVIGIPGKEHALPSGRESLGISGQPPAPGSQKIPAPHAPSSGSVPAAGKVFEVDPEQGDTLFDLLVEKGVPADRIHELVLAARPMYDLGRMIPGNSFVVTLDPRDGRVLRFEMDVDDNHRLVVARKGGALAAEKKAIDFQTVERVVSGVIRESLFGAADEAGLPPSLTLALAEVFSWDLDFHSDIRRGDRFQVLFQEKYRQGRFDHHGKILAARIMNQGRTYWAIRYKAANGGEQYYDLSGRSLRKVFLRSPLKYSRISSGFSRKRLHPILRIYRPHLGIDYAAPAGTPVRAIGDGRITFVGWRGNFGRFVRIRHNGIYTSTYGHLSGYARGIRRGKSVRQGEVIGYVGASGLATGPHLDFRLLKHGRYVDPLKVSIPNADPVKEADMAAFHRVAEKMAAKMESARPKLALGEAGSP